MKLKRIILISIIFLFLSSCSGNIVSQGNSGTQTPTSGKGLEVTFNLDTRWISTGRLGYELRISNSGKDPIELRPSDNLIFEIVESVPIITEESISEFYSTISRDSNLRIHNGENRIYAGYFEIEENFLQNTILESFTYILRINYDYQTQFENNLEIDPRFTGRNFFRIVDRVTQAAPVQIRSIEIIPGRGEEHSIVYHFENRGQTGNLRGNVIRINSFLARFSGNDISGTCKPVYREGEDFYLVEEGEYLLTPDKNLLAYCTIQIPNTETFTTQTNGEFSYNYKMELSGRINLPQRRQGLQI